MIQKLTSFNQSLYTKAVLCVRNPYAVTKPESADDMAKDAKEMMKKVLAASKSTASMEALVNMPGMGTPTSKYILVEVQYNPASVRMEAKGGQYKSMDRNGAIGSGSASAIVDRDEPVQKECKFQIVIDDTNNSDAFGISDNTSLTVGNIVESASSIAKSATGTNFSVKAKCEALMGLVLQSHLQDMIFCYGKMSFHGKLIDCSVHYTMFNKQGNPIRATIDMTLWQPADTDLFAYDVAEWHKKWQQAFKTGI